MKTLSAAILIVFFFGCREKEPKQLAGGSFWRDTTVAIAKPIDITCLIFDKDTLRIEAYGMVVYTFWDDTDFSKSAHYSGDTMFIKIPTIKIFKHKPIETVEPMVTDSTILNFTPPGFYKIPKDSQLNWEEIVDSLYKSKGLKQPGDSNELIYN